MKAPIIQVKINGYKYKKGFPLYLHKLPNIDMEAVKWYSNLILV